jgi:hypothetical protein
MKGLSPKWISWVKSFITEGGVTINVNDEVGPFFQTRKGLQQGDPLSPILFNIVADMLAILIERAKADNQVSGVVSHLVDSGLPILQYDDDTILFMEHDLEKVLTDKRRIPLRSASVRTPHLFHHGIPKVLVNPRSKGITSVRSTTTH